MDKNPAPATPATPAASGVRLSEPPLTVQVLIAKWRHAADHLGLEGLASLADCADELEAAVLASVAAPKGVQINLSEVESKSLRDFLDASDEPVEVTLSIGDGHSGRGLYVWESEYPEEGATFIAALSPPPPAAGNTEGGL